MPKNPFDDFENRLALTEDAGRKTAVDKRHAKGYRTARENLEDLCDPGSFQEYGRLAVAAQRKRRSYDELKTETAGDGIVTGTGTVNAELFGVENTETAIVVNDYSVLAGTQGFFHHKKLDRILNVAHEQELPVVMYTEGGGGRPGDTDVLTQIAGLNVDSFMKWAALAGRVPRIAVNNGYCFAGNTALYGAADITIATQSSNIGMAGPAMIEGGGLGTFAPTEVGPADVLNENGCIDVLATDEADATQKAKCILGFFQGRLSDWSCADQTTLRTALPDNRRRAYKVRTVIETVLDTDTFVELQPKIGGVVTGFGRVEGIAVGVMANDCQVLAGAIDGDSADKAARFIDLCNDFNVPMLSLCDTPGFMVGPDSEAGGAPRKMPRMFTSGARFRPPWIAVFLRRGYGLGAMAMTGGSFTKPLFICSWPQGEFGAMGLEGAAKLGFKRELEAEQDPKKRQAMFDSLVAAAYERGRSTEMASFLEIDAVIDPKDTRACVMRALRRA